MIEVFYFLIAIGDGGEQGGNAVGVAIICGDIWSKLWFSCGMASYGGCSISSSQGVLARIEKNFISAGRLCTALYF